MTPKMNAFVSVISKKSKPWLVAKPAKLTY